MAAALATPIGIACDVKHPQFEQVTNGALGEIDPSVSPDGRLLAYREMTARSPAVGVLRLLSGHGHDRILLGEGEFYGGVSWSPDSKWISYTNWERAEGGTSAKVLSVFKLNVTTGERVRLVSGNVTSGIGEYTSWNAVNQIAFSAETGLYAIGPAGGAQKELFAFEPGFSLEPEHLAWSPDGTSLAFSLNSDDGEPVSGQLATGIVVVYPGSGRFEQVFLGSGTWSGFPTWQSAEDLVFVSSAKGWSESPTPAIHAKSLRTDKTTQIEGRAIDFSPFYSRGAKALYLASAEQWHPSQGLLTTFHGFHIWKRVD